MKGFNLNGARVIPCMAFEFLYFDMIRNFIQNQSFFQINNNTNYLISGCFAAGFAYTTVYPIDFCRVLYTINAVPKDISLWRVFFHL